MAEITRFTFPDPDGGDPLEFIVHHKIGTDIGSITVPNSNDPNVEFVIYFQQYKNVRVTESGDVIYWIHSFTATVNYKNQPTLPF